MVIFIIYNVHTWQQCVIHIKLQVTVNTVGVHKSGSYVIYRRSGTFGGR